MDKLLTVIVPVFNDEINIVRCLDSLFNQTFDCMEVIVVDDASTDSTLTSLKKYQQKHPFKIISMKNNAGAGCCRNIGILSANTPYVTFVDSDDWIDISTYTRCFEEINDNPDVIIFGLVYDYITQNRQEEKYHYSRNYKTTGEFALNIYANTISNEINITPIVNNKVYRRQFLLDNDIFFQEELRYQEDDVFTFEILTRANSVTFVKGCSYHYCQRNDSLIHTVSELSIRSFISAYLKLESKLKSYELFEKHKLAYYLKFKGSLLGVFKRILDYEPDTKERNKLIHLLLVLLIENYDIPEILNTFSFLGIRSIL